MNTKDKIEELVKTRITEIKTNLESKYDVDATMYAKNVVKLELQKIMDKAYGCFPPFDD